MVDQYDSSFVCTYKNIDDDDLYRIQYLQAFRLNNWDDNIIMKTTSQLLKVAEPHFINIFNDLKTKKHNLSHLMLFLGNNSSNIDLFSMFFCIEVFQEFHACICDILKNNSIKDSNLIAFNKILFN